MSNGHSDKTGCGRGKQHSYCVGQPFSQENLIIDNMKWLQIKMLENDTQQHVIRVKKSASIQIFQSSITSHRIREILDHYSPLSSLIPKRSK